MSRNHNASIAASTLEVLERGTYTTPSGRTVSIAADLERAVTNTVLFTEGYLKKLEFWRRNDPIPDYETTIEVTPETALEATRRLSRTASDVVWCLNFASAKNPGGGFLGGAQAQEESLARSSGLYKTLLSQHDFYEFHRKQSSLLYSSRIIVSPDVPVFRDDHGEFLESPYLTAFMTCAAPNAGAIQRNEPHNVPFIPETLSERIGHIFNIARERGARRLVLGAWGCGVFQNTPETVAALFRGWLTDNTSVARIFEHVTFAVYDNSKDRATLEAFRTVFAEAS
jgi:uncharacterized protein (TIGR02452 family)